VREMRGIGSHHVRGALRTHRMLSGAGRFLLRAVTMYNHAGRSVIPAIPKVHGQRRATYGRCAAPRWAPGGGSCAVDWVQPHRAPGHSTNPPSAARCPGQPCGRGNPARPPDQTGHLRAIFSEWRLTGVTRSDISLVSRHSLTHRRSGSQPGGRDRTDQGTGHRSWDQQHLPGLSDHASQVRVFRAHSRRFARYRRTQ
jgi:hypothetical protein